MGGATVVKLQHGLEAIQQTIVGAKRGSPTLHTYVHISLRSVILTDFTDFSTA